MNIVQYNKQETVLFISGMFGGDWVWDKCRQHITGSNHLVMADALCSISSSIDHLIELIANELDSCSGKVTLVGSSLGGMIALSIAKQYPEKIQRVLIAGTAGFETVDLGIKLHPRRAVNIAHEIMGMVFHDDSILTEKVLNAVSTEFKHNFKSIIRLIRQSDALAGEEILKSVHCPVHAIWGKHDIVTPLSTVENTLSRFGVDTTVLDCGHCPMYEQPEAFALWVNSCIRNTPEVVKAA